MRPRHDNASPAAAPEASAEMSVPRPEAAPSETLLAPATDSASVAQPRISSALVAAVAAGLLLVTILAYIPALQGSFIWDDDDYVTENMTLQNLHGLRQIWFELGAVPQYYPLVHTTFWVQYHLHGLDPFGYHLVNVVLHGLSAFLLWVLLGRLAVPGALLAAAIFALHPVLVESVAWITERKNVLSCVFYLASALLYLKFLAARPRDRNGTEAGDFPANPTDAQRPCFAFYLGALLCYLLALLSKTVTSSLPAAILLVLWWKRGRITLRDVLSLLPFFVLGIGAGLLTSWMEKVRVGARGQDWDLSFVERCLIAGRALWFYAAKITVPYNLTFIYPRWSIDPRAMVQYLYPTTAVVVVAVLWFARRRIGRGPVTAALFFAGTLFPALGFFDVFPMRYSFVADHFQYHASIGLIAVCAAGVGLLARRHALKVPMVALSAGVLTALFALTWQQAGIYRTYGSVWEDTVAKNPRSPLALTCLASVRVAEQKEDEAVALYRRTLDVAPDDDIAHFNLGKLLLQRGDFDGAMAHFDHALQSEPMSASTHYFLAIALAQQGRMRLALMHFRMAVRCNPSDPFARYNYAVALQGDGKGAEAARQFETALRINPDWPEARVQLADTLVSLGRRDDATTQLEEALRQRPGWEEAQKRLASLK